MIAASDPRYIEVPVTGLKSGMFVVELDRPWLETPFAMQGFAIEDQDDVAYVAKYCSYVYIDPGRKVSVMPTSRTTQRQKARRDRVDIRQELATAEVDFESAHKAIESVYESLRANKRLNIGAIQTAINPLIDSVLRNREALAALVRMKDKSDYYYTHGLSTAVWAVVLGRHLGMDRQELQDLALGASIMDVGMTTLPDELLKKSSPLTDKELRQIKDHVKAGLRLISESGNTSNRVLNIVACHHERYDGSGYPRGLNSNQIPPMARIAGIADTYDAMITTRPFAKARSSYEAVLELQDLGDQHFQRSLIEQFVQTIGMFPTGSVVELSTGEVGVVVQQNPTRRLKPKVVIILDQNKHKKPEMTHVDLGVLVDDGAPAVWIARELELGAYDIHPHEYFI